MVYLIKVLGVIDVLFIMGLFLFKTALITTRRQIVSAKIIAIVLLTPAVALFCGNYYVFLIYLAGAVVVSASSRVEAAATYVVLLPLMPILSQETGAGGIYLLALSVAFAMGAGALIAAFIAGGRGRPITAPRVDLAVGALLVVMLVILAHGFSPTSLLRAFTLYTMTIIGPYLLLSRAVRNRADLDQLLLCLLIGATLNAVIAIFQAGWHWVLFEQYYGALRVRSPVGSFALSMRAGLLRTGGALNDYSAGGLYMAAMLTLLPLMRRHFTALGFAAITLVMIGGLFASQSRGAWAAAIVGFVVVAALRAQWGRVVLLGGGAVFAELMILTFARSGRLADMLGKGESTGNVTYRQDLFSQGIAQIKAHPVLGQSTPDLIAAMASLRQGEGIVDFVNAHLYVAMGAGVPLFLVWCAIWMTPVIMGWSIWRRSRNELAAVPAAIIVPSMTALTFTSITDRNLAWPVLALGLSAACFHLARAPCAGATRATLAPRRPSAPIPASSAPEPVPG